MSDLTNLGKKAEKQIEQWLDRPEEGYHIYRLKDQMTGFVGSSNPCDYIFYKKPYYYWIESKATYEDNFPYSMLTDSQYKGLLKISKVDGAHGWVIVLFQSYKRAFILDIKDIDKEISEGRKSINIKKIDKWFIPYIEIPTIQSRKELLDYDRNNTIFS